MELIIIAASIDISVYLTNSKCIAFLVILTKTYLCEFKWLKPKINMWLKTLKVVSALRLLVRKY